MPLLPAERERKLQQVSDFQKASTNAQAVMTAKAKWPTSRNYLDAAKNFQTYQNMIRKLALELASDEVGDKQQAVKTDTASAQPVSPLAPSIKRMPEPSAPSLADLQSAVPTIAQMLGDANAAVSQAQSAGTGSDAWLNQQYQRIMAPAAAPAPKPQPTAASVTLSTVPTAPPMSAPSTASASTSLPPLQTASDVQRQATHPAVNGTAQVFGTSDAPTVVLAASPTPAANSRAASVVSRNSRAPREASYTYLLDLAHEQSVLDAFKQAVQSSAAAAATSSASGAAAAAASSSASTSGKPKALTSASSSVGLDADRAFLRQLTQFNASVARNTANQQDTHRMLSTMARSQAVINRHATDPLYASELKKFKVWMHAQTAAPPRKPAPTSAAASTAASAAPISKSTTGGKMKHAALASAAAHGGWKATRARHAAHAELAW